MVVDADVESVRQMDVESAHTSGRMLNTPIKRSDFDAHKYNTRQILTHTSTINSKEGFH